VDRPVTRAWLEYPEELDEAMGLAARLSALGAPQPSGVAQLAMLRQTIWKRIPAQLDADNRGLTLEFMARVSGILALSFEDDLGLASSRLIELHTLPDPAPVVQLNRPTRSQDSFEVLPDAEITLRVRADDPQYALRSVYLEYRKKSEAGAEPVGEAGRLILYDHHVIGTLLPWVESALSRTPLLSPEPPHLRWQAVDVGRRWSLKDLNLKEGDVLTLQACADDFDDVTVEKKPGRSHEIELRVVSRTALEISLNDAQVKIQQELVRVQKQQQEALAKVIPAEAQWRNNKGQLEPKHVEELLQADQIQQQIRARLGDKQEGLRADVAKVLQTLKDNHMPPSGTQDRMKAVENELDRLDRDNLRQVEPLLTEARKEKETGTEKAPTSDKIKAPLTEARKHQEEIEKTLAGLLKLMEPWSTTSEVRGEAKAILQEQQKLQAETEKLKDQPASKSELEKLDPSQLSELEKTADLQKNLADRTNKLLDKLKTLSEDKERQAKDPEMARAMAEAADRGNQQDVSGKMQQAATDIRQNKLNTATKQQNAGAKAMEDVIKAMEDRREEELERLIKKMQEAEKKLDDLTRRQEELKKKVKEAQQNPDAKKREEELKRLMREQEQLQKEAQEMVRELSRLRADEASRALTQAGNQMQQSSRKMSRGENPEEQQQQTLDRLNEARQELQDARQDAEDELEREKLAKIADQVKGLKARQEALLAESARLHRAALEKKEWDRILMPSLKGLGRNQKNLGEETQRLADEKFAGAKVFKHLLTRSAEAMQQASDRIEERADAAEKRPDLTLDLPAEQTADEETQKLQRAALRRMDQLLDALKPENGLPRGLGQQQSGGQPGGGQPNGSGGQEDGIPPMAELKALKALQLEVNDRTKDFHKRYPDAAKHSEKQKQEMQSIKKEQEEVSDLFEGMRKSMTPEGDKK
jgi:hypothetical protein